MRRSETRWMTSSETPLARASTGERRRSAGRRRANDGATEGDGRDDGEGWWRREARQVAAARSRKDGSMRGTSERWRRGRSRARWVALVALAWTLGPFARKVVDGFTKVYVRRWMYPIERPIPCGMDAAVPSGLVDREPLSGLPPADMTNLPGLRPKKLKGGIISVCDSGVEAICAQSTANKQAYADIHGYDLIVDEDIVDRSRPTSWSKLLAMRKYLPEYDFLFYMDIDTIVMNPEKRLEDIVDFNFDQVLAADKNGVNCGMWMVRNTPWMLWFVDELWAQEQLVAPKNVWNMLFKYEQRAFHHLYASQIWRKVVKGPIYPKANTVRARTKVVNACVFNSQPAFYEPGDFVVHLAGLKGTVKCMWFSHYYKQALKTIRKKGIISPDADLPPPSLWTCLTKNT